MDIWPNVISDDQRQVNVIKASTLSCYDWNGAVRSVSYRVMELRKELPLFRKNYSIKY